VKIVARVRPFIGGSYLIASGGFMFWVAVFKTPEEQFVGGIVLAAGVALLVLGFLEIVTASRRTPKSDRDFVSR
jgi:hypothetical protein